MLTRLFDDPVRVQYRTHAGAAWVPALAFGIRRTDDGSYEVAITLEDDGDTGERVWVARSRVRAAPRLPW